MNYFYEKGYLLASYYIENPDSVTCQFTVTLGESFKWAQLKQGNLPDEIFLKTGFKKNIFQDDIFNFNRITKLFRSVVQYSERHGYPFARIKLVEIEIKEHRIAAKLYYDPGPYIYFGSLRIGPEMNLKSSFLAAYLNARPGMPFDQRKIDHFPMRLRQLAFIRLTGKPSILFRNDSCDIHLDLKKVKANSFDGIIGFLPNENEPDKLLITGQIFLGLDNLFRSGKKLNVQWQKPNLFTQELRVQYEHPALFRFPADLSMDFYLFKQDTSFINRDIHVLVFLNPVKISISKSRLSEVLEVTSS